MFDWLTVDRAISLSAVTIGAVFSAIAAVYSIRNYRLARETRDEATAILMRSWLLSISDETTSGGWHLCQIEQRGEPGYWIVQIEAINPKGAVLAPPDSSTYRAGDPGELRQGNLRRRHTGLQVGLGILAHEAAAPTLSFFIKSKMKSEIVSLRLTLEEMSASRRRRNIIVNSNPVAWSKIPAPRMKSITPP